MIKCKKGQVKIVGDIVNVHAEFAHITKALYNGMKANGKSEEEAKAYLDHAYEVAFLSKEELAEKKAEVLERLKSKGVEIDE